LKTAIFIEDFPAVFGFNGIVLVFVVLMDGGFGIDRVFM
jgi:hypothetical protein